MSARDELAELLFRSMPSSDDDEARREAAKAIDAFAHELAEKIREVASTTRVSADRPKLRYAADLIDPEVADA